jgi:hypothetical protein
MNAKQLVVPLAVLLVVGILVPVASAGDEFGGPQGFGEFLGDVFANIADFFSMGWLSNEETRQGFLRFLLFITVFTVIYSAAILVFRGSGGRDGFSGVGPDDHARRNAGIIATVISAITIVFTPMSLLVGIFSAYTAVILAVLAFVPVAAIYYLVYPTMGAVVDNQWMLRLVRVLGLLLIWLILAEVGNYANQIQSMGQGAGQGFQTIAALAMPATWWEAAYGDS